MITVHHLESSRSQRILWLLEELETPYQIKSYQREGSKLAPAALKQVHPLGKSPVITDGNRVVAESGAIAEYLVERYDREQRLTLSEEDEILQCRYWNHYSEGSLMPLLVMGLAFSQLEKPPVPWLARPLGRMFNRGFSKSYLQPQLTNHLEFIEQHLASHEWFAGGHFSIADVQMSFPIWALSLYDRLGDYPATQRWLDKITQRPAWRRAIEQGGSLELS